MEGSKQGPYRRHPARGLWVRGQGRAAFIRPLDDVRSALGRLGSQWWDIACFCTTDGSVSKLGCQRGHQDLQGTHSVNYDFPAASQVTHSGLTVMLVCCLSEA